MLHLKTDSSTGVLAVLTKRILCNTMKPKQKILLLAVGAISCSVVMTIRSYSLEGDTFSNICCGIFGFLGFLLFDVYRLKPSNSHTLRTALLHYIFTYIIELVGYIRFWKFEKDATDFRKQQQNLLKSILGQNQCTKFYKDHSFHNITSVEDFKQCVPLTTNAYYGDYIKSVVNENMADVLFPGKAEFIAMTSGTTSGKSKQYPKSLALQRKAGLQYILIQNLWWRYGIKMYLRKGLLARVHTRLSCSAHGVRRGPISSFMADSTLQFLEVTPEKGGKITSERESYYIHALFALKEEELNNISIFTVPSGLMFCKVLENNWEQLCFDIEAGIISESLNIPVDLRCRFNKNMNGGDQKRAEALRLIFKDGFQDILPRLWPTCSFVSVSGPAINSHTDILTDKYLGGVPILNLGHIATETIYGLNFYDKANMLEYTLLGQLNFFEFIKEEDIDSEQPDTLLAHQVEPGCRYEIVVTTREGLYRYRTEDVVEITGFHKTVPKYKVLRRTTDLLSVHIEKVPEFLLREALVTVSRDWGAPIVDYTSATNVQVGQMEGKITDTFFYMVFVELSEDLQLNLENSLKVDSELVIRHEGYARFRHKGTISPLQLVQVQQGTFEVLKETILEGNSSANCTQYKSPRIVKRGDLIRLLLCRRL